MIDVHVLAEPPDTRVRTSDLYALDCRTCGYTARESGLIAASTLVMLHKLRCCSDTHVCVLPAALRWTPLGDLATVPVGRCIDAQRCQF